MVGQSLPVGFELFHADREQRRKKAEPKEKAAADAAARERALEEKKLSRKYMWAAFIIGYPCGFGLFGGHRFVLSRVSGLIYPILFVLFGETYPRYGSYGEVPLAVLVILLFLDLFMIPKWSREKARKMLKSGKKPFWEWLWPEEVDDGRIRFSKRFRHRPGSDGSDD